MTPEDVKKLARLARIELGHAELENAVTELNTIFSFIEQLRAVDTSNIVPMAHAQDITQPLRVDQAEPCPERREELLSTAPAMSEGLLLVPPVIE
jgi:aspartyl-tRNA(Asn)/glutamyl-tRNA(Gln) amidotransferase subunit C